MSGLYLQYKCKAYCGYTMVSLMHYHEACTKAMIKNVHIPDRIFPDCFIFLTEWCIIQIQTLLFRFSESPVASCYHICINGLVTLNICILVSSLYTPSNDDNLVCVGSCISRLLPVNQWSCCTTILLLRNMTISEYLHILPTHDDVIKLKHFPCYWPFVRGIHRSPVNSLHNGQSRVALIFSLIYAWINSWVNIRKVCDLRRHRAHYDFIVMIYVLQSHGTSPIQCIGVNGLNDSTG